MAGLIAEPSFHLGADAPTEKVLGVDFNGYDVYVAAALFITGVWAFFDEQPAWVFAFPNNAADGIFHLVTGTLFTILAAVQLSQMRSSNWQSSTS